jgi:ABC-type transport system involved in multi-copper enzyme maturation permease subunit
MTPHTPRTARPHTETPHPDAPLMPMAAPAGPIRFGRLLRVEWRKSIDTRAARWLLAAIALLTAGATMVPLFLPQEIQQGWPSYLAVTALVLALLLPLVSIMTLTSEWGQRSVLVTFTQEPRRHRVVAAKVLSGLVLAILGAAFAFGIAAAAMAASDTLGRTVTWSVDGKYFAGFILFVIVNSLMGMAFGALLLNTPAAIMLFLVLPTLWTMLAYGWLEDIGRWLDTAQTYRYILESDWDGHTGPILLSLAAWVALPLAIGTLRTLRREVS